MNATEGSTGSKSAAPSQRVAFGSVTETSSSRLARKFESATPSQADVPSAARQLTTSRAPAAT